MQTAPKAAVGVQPPASGLSQHDNIKVAVRVRPLNSRELEAKDTESVAVSPVRSCTGPTHDISKEVPTCYLGTCISTSWSQELGC